MVDFVVMTPIYHGVDGITCWSIEKAHQAGLNFLWVPGTQGKGDALICRNRSVMATSFLEYVWMENQKFLDSDIVFEPYHLKKLYDDLKAGYDIIGGMYPTRSGTDNSSYFWGGKAPDSLGIHEVQFLSTGFMGISKYALQKIVREYRYPDGSKMPLLHPNTDGMRSYPFFEAHWGKNEIPDADGSTDIWISEDWDFCEKARAVGFTIYGDLDIQLGHQGTRIVTFLDVQEYRRKKAELEQKAEAKPTEEKVDYVSQSAEGAVC